MDIPFNDMPEGLNSGCRLHISEASLPIFILVNGVMCIELLELVIPIEMICVDFGPLLNRVLHHLGASYFSSVLHYESSHIFAATLVKAQHVNVILAPVSEARLIDFDSSAKLT